MSAHFSTYPYISQLQSLSLHHCPVHILPLLTSPILNFSIPTINYDSQALSPIFASFAAWSAAQSKHSPQNMLEANAAMPKQAVYKRLFAKGSEQTQRYHSAPPACTRKIRLKRQDSYKICTA